jgi:hypothetical protein
VPADVPAANAARIAVGAEPLRLKPLALPVEHGGWGMLAAPVLLGLLAAPSVEALGVGLAACFAFLARHPLKLAAADWLQARRTARTRAAERFGVLYAILAAGALAWAAGAPSGWWWPLAAALPLAFAQFLDDVRHQGRKLLPELLGAVALASVVASELRASGFGLAASFSAWAIVAAKTTSAVLYVRARIRCDRGLAFGRAAVLLAHVLGLVAALGLAAAQQVPWLAALGFGLLLARAAQGLSRAHRRVPAKTVGFMELAWSGVFVVLTALGYATGL